MSIITQTGFGRAGGSEARLFTLTAGEASVSICDLGCTVTDFIVPSRFGEPVNIALGYSSAAGYALGSSFLGATVGRYAGRIAKARFGLGGKDYRLEPNDGENHLHGGFSKRIWKAEQTESRLRLGLFSPEGDEGFPGSLEVSVTAELLPDRLVLTYEGETDAPTHLNLTNHSYFNLAGGGDIKRHLLWVNAEEFAELQPGGIPTGRLINTAGTALDFCQPKPIGPALTDEYLAPQGGIDHSFALHNNGALCTAASLYCPESGIKLTCRTTQPSVHIYTANFLHLDAAGVDRNGKTLLRYGGVCLETQRFPNSPNLPVFPSTLLLPGERYREVTEFVFGHQY